MRRWEAADLLSLRCKPVQLHGTGRLLVAEVRHRVPGCQFRRHHPTVGLIEASATLVLPVVAPLPVRKLNLPAQVGARRDAHRGLLLAPQRHELELGAPFELLARTCS